MSPVPPLAGSHPRSSPAAGPWTALLVHHGSPPADSDHDLVAASDPDSDYDINAFYIPAFSTTTFPLCFSTTFPVFRPLHSRFSKAANVTVMAVHTRQGSATFPVSPVVSPLPSPTRPFDRSRAAN